jgi:hypothetical protein
VLFQDLFGLLTPRRQIHRHQLRAAMNARFWPRGTHGQSETAFDTKSTQMSLSTGSDESTVVIDPQAKSHNSNDSENQV